MQGPGSRSKVLKTRSESLRRIGGPMNKQLTTLRTLDALVEAGLVPTEQREGVAAVARRYAIAIPPAITSLIETAGPADPIARQFVPSAAELHATADELSDPIGDDTRSPLNGIVHRYPDRVLLKLANVCPVYCRFCFRRETVGLGGEASLSADELAAALAYIEGDPRIFEVIVTGGDPLIISPRRIAEVTEALDAIAHVRVIRWHSRVPVVAPERVTRELAAALTVTDKAVFVALHTNHVRELTTQACAAIGRLADAGVSMLSQSVLLKGVNDNVESLEALLRGLLAARVKPYYLHHGDLAPGTSHFRTTLEDGRRLMAELRGRLSGAALPAYVLDIPGGHGKVPVDPDHVGPPDPMTGERRVIDPWGQAHVYRDRKDDRDA